MKISVIRFAVALAAAACGLRAAVAATMTMPAEADWAKPIYAVCVEGGAVDLQEVTVTAQDGAITTQTGADYRACKNFGPLYATNR